VQSGQQPCGFGLRLPQDAHAVLELLDVNEIVMDPAQQDQVGVLVAVLVRHRMVASRPVSAVSDDVGDLAEERGFVGRRPRLDQFLLASGEGTEPARPQVDDSGFGKRHFGSGHQLHLSKQRALPAELVLIAVDPPIAIPQVDQAESL
jgi:hypothetical protein